MKIKGKKLSHMPSQEQLDHIHHLIMEGLPPNHARVAKILWSPPQKHAFDHRTVPNILFESWATIHVPSIFFYFFYLANNNIASNETQV